MISSFETFHLLRTWDILNQNYSYVGDIVEIAHTSGWAISDLGEMWDHSPVQSVINFPLYFVNLDFCHMTRYHCFKLDTNSLFCFILLNKATLTAPRQTVTVNTYCNFDESLLMISSLTGFDVRHTPSVYCQFYAPGSWDCAWALGN